MSRSGITVGAAIFVMALAACGGGGSSSSSGGGTPPVQPAPPSTNSATVQLQPKATSVPLPPVGSYSGMMSMPAGSGMVTITSMMTPPAGIPAPSGVTPMMYVLFSASGGAVSMSQTPGFDMDMMSSSMMGSASYYMAEYLNGSWTTVEGPAMMSGTSMMMGFATTPISLGDGQQVCFVYYMGGVLGSPGPSPAPSSMPSMMP